MGVMARLLENALAGTALILSCAGLRALLKGRVPPGVWLGLWGIEDIRKDVEDGIVVYCAEDGNGDTYVFISSEDSKK